MYHLWMTLLHHIPEGIVVFYVGFFLTKVMRPTPLLLLLGAVYGVSLGLFRALLPLGYHMPAIVVETIALYRWGAQLPWSRATFAAVSSFVLIGLSGIVMQTVWIMWSKLTLETVLTSVPLSLFGAWLEDVFLIALALFAYVSRQRSGQMAAVTKVKPGEAS